MFDWATNPEAWAALATLTALEIVLGIDNIVFIAILSGRLPQHQQRKARLIGLGLAMSGRIALLLSIVGIMRLTAPLFEVWGRAFSGRDLILLAGGFFFDWEKHARDSSPSRRSQQWRNPADKEDIFCQRHYADFADGSDFFPGFCNYSGGYSPARARHGDRHCVSCTRNDGAG